MSAIDMNVTVTLHKCVLVTAAVVKRRKGSVNGELESLISH